MYHVFLTVVLGGAIIFAGFFSVRANAEKLVFAWRLTNFLKAEINSCRKRRKFYLRLVAVLDITNTDTTY